MHNVDCIATYIRRRTCSTTTLCMYHIVIHYYIYIHRATLVAPSVYLYHIVSQYIPPPCEQCALCCIYNQIRHNPFYIVSQCIALYIYIGCDTCCTITLYVYHSVLHCIPHSVSHCIPHSVSHCIPHRVTWQCDINDRMRIMMQYTVVYDVTQCDIYVVLISQCITSYSASLTTMCIVLYLQSHSSQSILDYITVCYIIYICMAQHMHYHSVLISQCITS